MARGRVQVDIDAELPTLKDMRFGFSALDISAAANKRYLYAHEKMIAAKGVFLAEIVKSVPPGIQIDVNLIDIDSVEGNFHGSTSSVTYSQNIQLPMTEKCSNALTDYNRYRSERRKYYRMAQLFKRAGDVQVQISDADAEDLRIFEPS